MGRKIPGRKHRGIRDPEKQAAVRFNVIKDKINAPPSNPDDQAIPKSLHKFIELKNKVKTGVFNIKRKNKKKKSQVSNENDILLSKNEQSVGKPEKPIPVFKQLHGESDREFVKRMNRICISVTKEAEFEQKYGVDIKRNEDGEIEGVLKRPKDELELMVKKLKNDKKEKKNKRKKEKLAENGTTIPRLTKSQKRQNKLKDKKMRKQQQNADGFEKYKDNVKFGEIVHAPPSLTAPRRAEKLLNAPRPGKKSLLLNNLMQTKDEDRTPLISKTKEVIRKTTSKTIDKKGKRKALPHALRRQLDKQQKEIISAYKELKSKMHKT
ncbi:unnamed protein product [Phaedon cochleariae]|uniref:Coiled-coil domain-containing protein 137 n=1 Tax=Phaedon cochleariae TaxID=80249 RepID=A0A9N9SLW6_PHACE|nr:unnamed protein product [Phaedon cochleariae]